MAVSILESIQQPADIHAFSPEQLTALSEEIRAFLIQSVSKTGGHIGANLGTIELTVALHAVFHSPEDPFLFDTGHQGYTHKLLTGRLAQFATLNQPHGMSRFLTREESLHDTMDATHAGTAISIASGLAMGKRLNKEPGVAVAVVGDGSLVEGCCFEGLNFGMTTDLPLMIVVNDNGMAIAPNVGGIRHLFAHPQWAAQSRAFFEGLGYQYLAVPEGHSIPDLLAGFREAKNQVKQGPVVVHVKTIKGKGLPYADGHKYRMHFSMPFDPVTGQGASPTLVGETYGLLAAQALYDMMAQDPNIVALTPATPYASYLDRILEDFPDRAIDVGMAEQHAVCMAAGLALNGKHPVVCFQSTFMQRAMDPILHDLCFMNLPVTLMVVRSGFAGFDGPTHHGIYDLSYLQALPNLKLFYAGTRFDVEAIVRWRMQHPDGPMAILYPYEGVRTDEVAPLLENQDITRPEIVGGPASVCLVATGNTLGTVYAVREALIAKGQDVCVVNIRWMKPFPEQALLPYLEKARYVVTFEENIATGGLGSRVATMLADRHLTPWMHRVAIADGFVRFGDKADLCRETGIDAQSVLAALGTILNLQTNQ